MKHQPKRQRETDTGLLHLDTVESDGKKENKRVGAAFAHKKARLQLPHQRQTLRASRPRRSRSRDR